jgi:GGDEF domain-containing protein
VGDAFVKIIVSRLKSLLGEAGQVYRSGPDKFYIILSNTLGQYFNIRDYVDSIANSILSELSSPIKIEPEFR